ncbi:MAG TPA: BTAD domain-containing putative transcriptional regulator [Anaerolineae bacterium]|nr:BTAD domain-containing putative transcriptional regulator [Anaerolineae bacterium]
MARLELFLLGPPRLERDGVPLQFDTRKILALVAYLAVSSLREEGRRLRRDSLITLLWPELEPPRARAVLRRNLSLLRTALEGEWLVVDRHTVATDPEAEFWLDVDRFTQLVHAWQTHGHLPEQVCPQCLEALTEAATLYQGNFLEGFGLRDSVEYDDWQFFQTEGLRKELALALERLVRGHSGLRNHEVALPYARRWLALDPLHEPAHRQLMQIYLQTGQRSAGLRQYTECVRILEEELGLAPAEETTALYEQIRASPPPGRHPALTRGPIGGIGLPDRTPPRHNLPAQTTPFVGREKDLAELSTRLQDPTCRLLTLLGPGGIGKTRLALQLAEDLFQVEESDFEHGVFFVPLAPLQTAEAVVPAVAEALSYSFPTDIEDSTRATKRQQLLDYLRRKHLLLVMDNYEHLLIDGTPKNGQNESDGGSDGVGFVTDVLSSAPGVKVLVTSRVSLKVQGEHLYPLAGLRVPDATLLDPVDTEQILRGYSAIELFVQGARQVRPDFELRSSDLVHVAHICRLVQGMPLGILLAAAWVEMLAPEEIAAEIQRTLDFLETDLRDVPLRQSSIRAAFDHSWQLLDERERAMFQGLSVFLGGFTREAALEVSGASLRDLMSLVNKSLLLASSPGRYEMHELLRQYAVNRLDLAPEQGKTVRDRHCAYYSAAMERWAGELKGPRQREAMDEIDLEIENGRAAWYWAVVHKEVARLAQSADGIWLYHAWRLRHEEAEAAFRAAVDGLEDLDAHDAQRLRAKCLILWSHFQLDLAWKERSLEAAEQGLNLLQDLESSGQDVRHEMALAAFHEARIMRYYHPDPLEAKRLYARSVAFYEEVGDRWGLARALAYLGWMAEQIGRLAEAQDLCQKSLAIRQELGDQRGMADAMLNLGIISWVQGRLDEAQHLLQESLGISWALGDWIRIARTLKSLGEVLARCGRYDDGLALMENSIDIFDELVYAFGVSGAIPFLAEAKLHLGRYEEARADAMQGKVRADQGKHRWSVGFSLFVNGLAALAEGVHREALSLFQESAAIFAEIRHRENRGWVLGPLGLAARERGEKALAWHCVVEALEIGCELGAFMPVIYGLPAVALLLADQGAAVRAVEVYACASRYEFVANSCWFEDVVAEPLAAAVALLPAEQAEAARARGQALEWDGLAAELLAEMNGIPQTQ